MQLHQLKSATRRKPRKRIGRGGAHGTYSTRGLKGQKARSGGKIRPGFEGGRTPLKKLVPKGRGVGSFKLPKDIVVIKLSELTKNFKENETVNPKTLFEKKFLKYPNQSYKILSNGEVRHGLIVEKSPLSAGAKEKILKAGGKVS